MTQVAMSSHNMNAIESYDGYLKMPLVQLHVRTSLIHLQNGKRILLSPHPSLTKEEFTRMGDVTDIVAPNLFHHLGIKKAVAALPKAKLWGINGFDQKRKDLPWQSFVTGINWPYNDELIALPLDGMPKVNECLFLHKPSKTLFVTDLCFNILDSKGFGAWLIYSLFGTNQRFATSKFFVRAVTDKAAFQASLDKLFKHDFDNLVPCHGSVITGNAKALLRDALKERGFAV
ncbi:MAG: hypothetical protein IPN04_06815 [Rhodoferax sp.]|jgi:hypothetical protein|nr:hypothetical protein [Rhodoferax sp.]